MQYLTSEQVFAKTKGPRSALRLTIQHHKQNARMPEDDFPFKANIRGAVCGLCVWAFRNHSGLCDDCPLYPKYACNKYRSLWLSLGHAVRDGDYPAFVAAEKKMVKILESLL